jgi:hypothetical protein
MKRKKINKNQIKSVNIGIIPLSILSLCVLCALCGLNPWWTIAIGAKYALPIIN